MGTVYDIPCADRTVQVRGMQRKSSTVGRSLAVPGGGPHPSAQGILLPRDGRILAAPTKQFGEAFGQVPGHRKGEGGGKDTRWLALYAERTTLLEPTSKAWQLSRTP